MQDVNHHFHDNMMLYDDDTMLSNDDTLFDSLDKGTILANITRSAVIQFQFRALGSVKKT